MQLPITKKCQSLEQTRQFAKEFAHTISKGSVVLLKGDLGAGKTQLVRYIVAELLGNKVQVSSPTYNIVNVYEANNKAIWHYDLYRLEHQEELEELGLDEAMEKAILLIEWPEIAKSYIPKPYITLEIKITGLEAREFYVS